MTETTEILLIRHAPAEDGGCVAGRRDVAAAPVPDAVARALRDLAGGAARLVSPARRCVMTAEAIWPGADLAADPRLWEQDFGDWEGRPFTGLPDLGPLAPVDLARHRPPGGESFADLCARIGPVIDGLRGRVAVVAHAGTVRAGLALATGSVPGALAFQVAPLSLTRLLHSPGGWSIAEVNRRFG